MAKWITPNLFISVHGLVSTPTMKCSMYHKLRNYKKKQQMRKKQINYERRQAKTTRLLKNKSTKKINSHDLDICIFFTRLHAYNFLSTNDLDI